MCTHELTHSTTVFFHRFLELVSCVTQNVFGFCCSSVSSSAKHHHHHHPPRPPRAAGKSLTAVLTWEDAAGVGGRVHAVAVSDAVHLLLGSMIMLSDQQPAQRLRKHPEQRNSRKMLILNTNSTLKDIAHLSPRFPQYDLMLCFLRHL